MAVGQRLGRQAEGGQRPGAVALDDHVGPGEEALQRRAPGRGAQVEQRAALARTRVQDLQQQLRESGRVDPQDLRAQRGERAGPDGPGDHAGEVEHAQPPGRRRPGAGGGVGRRARMRVRRPRDERLGGDRGALRVRGPGVRRPHRRGAAARRDHGVLASRPPTGGTLARTASMGACPPGPARGAARRDGAGSCRAGGSSRRRWGGRRRAGRRARAGSVRLLGRAAPPARSGTRRRRARRRGRRRAAPHRAPSASSAAASRAPAAVATASRETGSGDARWGPGRSMHRADVAAGSPPRALQAWSSIGSAAGTTP